MSRKNIIAILEAIKTFKWEDNIVFPACAIFIVYADAFGWKVESGLTERYEAELSVLLPNGYTVILTEGHYDHDLWVWGIEGKDGEPVNDTVVDSLLFYQTEVGEEAAVNLCCRVACLPSETTLPQEEED